MSNNNLNIAHLRKEMGRVCRAMPPPLCAPGRDVTGKQQTPK